MFTCNYMRFVSLTGACHDVHRLAAGHRVVVTVPGVLRLDLVRAVTRGDIGCRNSADRSALVRRRGADGDDVGARVTGDRVATSTGDCEGHRALRGPEASARIRVGDNSDANAHWASLDQRVALEHDLHARRHLVDQ